MADGRITSFFNSSASYRDEESVGPANNFVCNGAVSTGLTIDLCGLLRSGSTEDQADDKKKKKRAHRKRGNIHLTRVYEDGNCVALEPSENKVVVCEEVSITDPDKEGVVWLSPLKQKPSLSSSWQQVFGRTQKKSPIKKSMSSPKRCPSPRQMRKSPLKQAVKRQLLSMPSATTTRTDTLPIDNAPYTNLVHVQQIDKTTEISAWCTLPPLYLPVRVECQPSLDVTGDMLSLGMSNYHPPPVIMPSFEPVSDRSACLNEIQKEYPHLKVSDIDSFYSSLTWKCQVHSGKSLICSVRVKVCDTGITVDQSAYPTQPNLQDHMYSDLWSSLYRPRTSREVIGNSTPCSKFCAWLSKWKAESSTPDTDKREDRIVPRCHDRHQTRSGWWISDCDDDFMPPDKKLQPKKQTGLARRYLDGDIDAESAEEEELCAVILLYGPPGSGKTAAVYACAQELGFGVFEVNSSSFRGRAQMLSTLREVTLSHQVAQRRRNGLTVLERDQKEPQTVSLESNTLILLEEVDVLFEEEERGFWSAVYEIIRSTKRPFVMTCSDSSIELFCPHLRLLFDRPHTVDLAAHIRLLSLAHGMSLSSSTANQITSSFKSDIRKIFNFMHTWLSWLPSNYSQLPGSCSTPSLDCCKLPPHCRLSTDWRMSPLHSALHVHMPSYFQQSDLFTVAAHSDVHATLDLLNPVEVRNPKPWWLVTPVVHLLDELPHTTSADSASIELQSDIAMEITRLVGVKPDHEQICLPTLHDSLKDCLEAFSLNWRMARVALVTEGLPFLRLMSILEDRRRAAWCKRRFHHYLKQVDVPTESLTLLANTAFV